MVVTSRAIAPDTAAPFHAGGMPAAALPSDQSVHDGALATAQAGAAPNRPAMAPPSCRDTSCVATATQLVLLTPAVTTATLAAPAALGVARSTAVASAICGRTGCEATPHGLTYGTAPSTSAVDDPLCAKLKYRLTGTPISTRRSLAQLDM